LFTEINAAAAAVKVNYTDGHKASSDLSATAELLFFCFSRVVDYAGYTHQLFPAR